MAHELKVGDWVAHTEDGEVMLQDWAGVIGRVVGFDDGDVIMEMSDTDNPRGRTGREISAAYILQRLPDWEQGELNAS